jgi:hypothetical protein
MSVGLTDARFICSVVLEIAILSGGGHFQFSVIRLKTIRNEKGA